HAAALDFNEFYLGASYGIASATVYVGDSYKYTEFGAGTTVADMFDASVAFGIVSPDTGSSVNQTTFGLSKDFDNISANLTVGTFDTLDTEFAIGVNASF
ncbi:MAG: hypothetical protein Q9M19_01945, partial [Mariprofundaceae bacterium]|nr:hypothetical protein [Mariprofundaceae bacterium]